MKERIIIAINYMLKASQALESYPILFNNIVFLMKTMAYSIDKSKGLVAIEEMIYSKIDYQIARGIIGSTHILSVSENNTEEYEDLKNLITISLNAEEIWKIRQAINLVSSTVQDLVEVFSDDNLTPNLTGHKFSIIKFNITLYKNELIRIINIVKLNQKYLSSKHGQLSDEAIEQEVLYKVLESFLYA